MLFDVASGDECLLEAFYCREGGYPAQWSLHDAEWSRRRCLRSKHYNGLYSLLPAKVYQDGT